MGPRISVNHYVQAYGDLLFDLCESMLLNREHSQIAFRTILKKIWFASRFQNYSRYERSWVLKLACEQLLKIYRQNDHKPSPEEQIKLDENANLTVRLSRFSSYFQRLAPEDQILFILKDKHKIPDSEISAAMTIPEGSLKVRRQQALRALEGWLWNLK